MGKALDTKTFIIEKAALIFNRHGYAATSMSQLAQAIQMTKGAIYGNFKDKDEIALAAFDYNFSLVAKRIQDAVRSKDNACDKLIAMATHYLDRYAELSGSGGCPILNATVDSDNVHEALKARVAQALDTWMQAVVKIIYKGIKEKQIHANARPEMFASVFVSLIEGGMMLSKATGSAIHLSRNIDHVIHLVNTELRI